MKTKAIILTLISIFVSQVHFSQSLLIKGFFKSDQEEPIQASYLLIANNEVVSSGDEKKIKIQLELNNDYTLIVSKNGYVTKSISFSTYTKDEDDYYFEFDVFLKRVLSKNTTVSIISANVYYDSKLRSFNYVVNKNQY